MREMELLREDIIRRPLAFGRDNQPIYMGVSIGICHNNVEDDITHHANKETKKDFRQHLVQLIRSADDAMYTSKISGKNMISSSYLFPMS